MVATVGFRVLGPLEVAVGGHVVPLSAGKQRAILAALLLQANRVVPVDELVDKLWDGAQPRNARGTVQKYVMRLRRVLAEHGLRAVIHTEIDGYRIVVAPGELDLARFGELSNAAARAAATGNRNGESELLREALALWRSVPPLSDVPAASLRWGEVNGLVERYLQGVDRRVELDLERGLHGELVGELAELVHRYPLRERFWMHRMRALFGSGQQGAALDVYREVAQLLAEELGIDPGSELQSVHREILAGESTEDASEGRTAAAASDVVLRSVRQLPMAVAGFVGRAGELARIVDEVQGAETQGRASLVVISGPAGVGKTALAVHAAHRVADDFECQLFVDLRGHAPSAPLTTTEALGQFLRALGLPPDAVPLNVDDQVKTYRSLLAERRVLVLLEDVATVDQVRSLLPGSQRSAVIVTSRHELGGLEVAPGARRIALAMLTPADARRLLFAVLGADRVETQEQSAGELIRRCGGLALALRVAAAHLALRPQLRVAEYVGQLEAHGLVSALHIDGDERADLTAAFDWSYLTLPPMHRCMLRMLGLVPGPDFTVPTAAALCEMNQAEAAAALEALAAASLLERHPMSRFALHDLIRDYALLRSAIEETDAERRDARRRLFEHYIETTDSVVQPLVTVSRLPRPAPSGPPADPQAALAALDADLTSLIAAVRSAAEVGPHDSAYHLADALRGYFTLQGRSTDWLTVAEAGLVAARTAADDEAIAAMLNSRGAMHYYIGETERAGVDYRAALELYERLGSPAAHAVRINLGAVASVNGDLQMAVRHQEAAMIAYRRMGEEGLELLARGNLVIELLELGELERATRESAPLTEATTIPGSARRLGVMALLARHVGDLRRAASLLRHAAAAANERGDQRMEGCLLGALAQCCVELGQNDEAERIAEGVLASQRDLNSVEAVQVALADVLRLTGRHHQARERFEIALLAARSARNRGQECDVLIGLAELELATGAPRAAIGRAREAVTLARVAPMGLRLARALAVLGAAYRHRDDHDRARLAAEEALSVARRCDFLLGQGLAMVEIGETRCAVGNHRGAHRSWHAAERMFTEIGSRRAGEVADLLATLS